MSYADSNSRAGSTSSGINLLLQMCFNNFMVTVNFYTIFFIGCVMADKLEEVVLKGILGMSLAVCAGSVGVVVWYPEYVKDSYAPHVVAFFSGMSALMSYAALYLKSWEEDKK